MRFQNFHNFEEEPVIYHDEIVPGFDGKDYLTGCHPDAS